MPEAPTPTRPQPPPDPRVDYSVPVGDTVKTTTCYMCACRCGIKVHLRDGRIRYIEGNPKHPVNRGVICGKGASGIMQQYSPAKLSKPLLRVGERGAGSLVATPAGRGPRARAPPSASRSESSREGK